MPASAPFSSSLFTFLEELAANNRREWFFANQERFWRDVRDPALRFIAAAGPVLRRVSPRIVADPRPIGGSLYRIYRDTRFSADKSLYKTHAAMRFPVRGVPGDGAQPGFYLHLAPGSSFIGAGVWHPDPKSLGKIRQAIVKRPASWTKARNVGLSEGDQLTGMPRGFSTDHRFADDLRRKSFVASAMLNNDEVTSPRFMAVFEKECRRMWALVLFVSSALAR